MAELNLSNTAAPYVNSLHLARAIWPRFAEFFVVCGLNESRGLELEPFSDPDLDVVSLSPLERSYKPDVLAFYPNDAGAGSGEHAAVFDPNSVCMLCLPRGLVFYTQRHVTQPQFHPFIITKEDGSRYFGFSLVFYEEVADEKLRHAMKTLQEMFIAEMSTCSGPRFALSPKRHRSSQEDSSAAFDASCKATAFSSTLPRSFKVQYSANNAVRPDELKNADSSSPCAGDVANAQQTSPPLYHMEKDKLFVSKSICLVSLYPFAAAFKMLLLGLYHRALSQSTQATQIETVTAKVWLPLESFVFNVLYEVPVPPPGHSVQCVCFPHNEIVIHMPGALELPLLDYPLRELFAVFDVAKLVDLLTGVALEHQILLYSQDYGRLMLVAESLVALLFPFAWQSVYVPILPASLHCFLDAPVPFIMGLHGPRQHAATMARADMCFANIDDGTIHLPEEMPKLPLRKELCQILQKLYVATYPEDQHGSVAPSGTLENTRRSRSRSSTPGVFHTASNVVGGNSNEVKQLTNELAEMISKLDADTSAATAAGDNDVVDGIDIDPAKSHTSDVGDAAVNNSTSTSSSPDCMTNWNNPHSHNFPGMRRNRDIIGADAANRKSGSPRPKSKAKTSIKRKGAIKSAAAGSTSIINYAAPLLSEDTALQQRLRDAQFDESVRRSFLLGFVYLMFSYETYIIQHNSSSTSAKPVQAEDEVDAAHAPPDHNFVMDDPSLSVLSPSFDTAENFDKVAFLSDQPERNLQFLSSFLATQLFASFIDKKSLAVKRTAPALSAATPTSAAFTASSAFEFPNNNNNNSRQHSARTPTSAATPIGTGGAAANDAVEFKNVYIFDDTIRSAREKCGEEVEFRKLTFKKFVESMSIDMTQLIARLTVPTMYAPEPHRLPLAITKSNTVLNSPTTSSHRHSAAAGPHKFPILDTSLLSIEHATAVLVATGMIDAVLSTANAASSLASSRSQHHHHHQPLGSPKKFSSVLANRMAARMSSNPVVAAGGRQHHRQNLLMSPNKSVLPANSLLINRRHMAVVNGRNNSSSSAATTPQTPDSSSTTTPPPSNMLPNVVSRQLSTADIAQTNANFIESILKECKQKVKKMLMAKMGHEAVEQLGLTQAEAVSGVEENTQISSLCDLIERIWTHGRNSLTSSNNNKQQCKSALWHHLLVYQQLHEKPSPIGAAAAGINGTMRKSSQPLNINHARSNVDAADGQELKKVPVFDDDNFAATPSSSLSPSSSRGFWSVNNSAADSPGGSYSSIYEQLQEAKSKGFEHMSKIVSYMSSASLYTTPPILMKTEDERRALFYKQAAEACIAAESQQRQSDADSEDELDDNDDQFCQNTDGFNTIQFCSTDDSASRSSGPTTFGFLGGTLDRQKFRLGSLKSRFRTNNNAAALPSSTSAPSATSEAVVPQQECLARIGSAPKCMPPSALCSSSPPESFAERALLRDIRHVTHGVASVKSAVGYARAFIRLALEKKLLSQHFKTLLSDEMILKKTLLKWGQDGFRTDCIFLFWRSRTFKPYAFLRSEDEREQFLFHILSLNAVDYYCFTNTYLDTPMPMTIGVTATGSPNASLWAALCGTHCHTDPFYIPRGSHNYTVKPKNIGLVELVKIGLVLGGQEAAQPSPAPASNASPSILPTRSRTGSAVSVSSAAASPLANALSSSASVGGAASRLWLDEVVIRNQITGHVYRFACSRWLGRGVDDDASERWLIGRRVSIGVNGTTPTSSSTALMPSVSNGNIEQHAASNGAASAANVCVEIPLRISDDVDEELLAEQQSNSFSGGIAKMGVGPRHANAMMPGAPHLVAAHSAVLKNVAVSSVPAARGRSVEPTAGRATLSAAIPARIAEPSANISRLRSPSVPRQLAGEGKLTTTQIERLLGESANVLVKHFHHAQLQPSNVNGTLRVHGSSSTLLRSNNGGSSLNTTSSSDSEHSYVNPFVLLCRPNGIVSRLELALYVGFRASRFSLWEGTKQFFLWDFIERASQHFRMEVLLREKLAPNMRAAIEKFCTLVKRLDEQAGALGKDGKFRLFVCLSLRDKCLAQNVELLSRTPSIDAMFDERCLLRSRELKAWLYNLLDSLAQYNIFFDPAFTKGL